MRGGDGTGPMGMGPMTGRGAGYCAGFPNIPYAPYPAYGGTGAVPYGFPQASGTTPGSAPFATGLSPEQELNFPKDQGGALKSQIDQINSCIKELEKMEK